MHRHEYTAKVGFVKTLDRTCKQHGGIYSSTEHSVCPKCQQPLVIPSHNTENGPRPYCFSEVTLYPLLQKEVKDRHEKRLKVAGGLITVIRVVLWGKYSQENNTLQPDPRVRYLAPKRTVRVLFNTPPLPKAYTAKDGSTKLELKYTFDGRHGDQFEFLDSKQEATAHMEATSNVSQPSPQINAGEYDTSSLNTLANQLATLTKRFEELTANAGIIKQGVSQDMSTMELPEEDQYIIFDDDVPF